MKKTNLQIFEALDESQFFCSFERAARHFRDLRFFPDALGFDVESGGFLVLHRLHDEGAIFQELPVCILLKKLGHGIFLLPEDGVSKSADAQINDWIFEIKRISKAKKLDRAIEFHFRKTYRKSGNILLHIDQDARPSSIRTAIMQNATDYPNIRHIWIVFQNRLTQLERKIVLKGEFQIK